MRVEVFFFLMLVAGGLTVAGFPLLAALVRGGSAIATKEPEAKKSVKRRRKKT